MTRSWRAVILVAVVAVLTLLAPGAAHAHSSEIGSTPAAGAILDAPPREVTVEFDTPLLDIGAAMVVRTDAGVVVSTGTPRVDRLTLATSIAPDAPDGIYTVAYRVVSKDGHTVESSFDFRVGAAQASAPASTPTPSAIATGGAPMPADDRSVIVWVLAGVVAAVIVGAGVAVLKR